MGGTTAVLGGGFVFALVVWFILEVRMRDGASLERMVGHQSCGDVLEAELAQQNACERFELISEKAKEELVTFGERRVSHFRKNLVGLAELQLKHAKAQLLLLSTCLQNLSDSAASPAVE
ncbi:hypothetical protein FHG87_021995 [Trinorchestia longiramus]|nr:hypothetical protein FHG87_021995 [Trinorchestia longiramus]